jgi:hypothetical protein
MSRNKIVKVHVCFTSYDYEGNSEPEAVFSDEEKAKEWVRANNRPRRGPYAQYKTLENQG